MDSYKEARNDYRHWKWYSRADRKTCLVNAAIAADRCRETCPEWKRDLWDKRIAEIDAELYNL
jgi:hypothetical protein